MIFLFSFFYGDFSRAAAAKKQKKQSKADGYRGPIGLAGVTRQTKESKKQNERTSQWKSVSGPKLQKIPKTAPNNIPARSNSFG